MAFRALSVNCAASSCSCESSSKVGSAYLSSLVNFTDNINGSSSISCLVLRNCCVTSRSSLFQISFPFPRSTPSYAAFSLPLSNVPSTATFVSLDPGHLPAPRPT
ncbi:unnamed protein product [Heterobilharzia americana]|nr:unnamed protein product [Heterobilharzia americana]